MDRAPVFGTGGCRFESCRVHTGKFTMSLYNDFYCGYGSRVEHVFAKDEIRVRVPVAAPKQKDVLRGVFLL
jgi:hypothetical protein